MSEDRTICYNCFCEREGSEGACPNCGYDPEWDKDEYPLALPHGVILNDKYLVGRVLGQGGYGITYLAIDRWLGTKVAIKEYFPEVGAIREGNSRQVTASSVQKQADYQRGKEDFLKEARVLAAFSGNPNIVKIEGYFEENGTAYFAMEYIEGISLQRYLSNNGGKISWKDAYEKLLPIIKALEEVHKKEIIHRDISPDNIYITSEGTVKLLDFGAARQQSLNQSHSLDVILKHGFAPFEQYSRRGKQGPFTDVYALCACFYASVTGFLPKDAPERMQGEKLETFEEADVEIPTAVAQVIYQGMAVDAEDRYQNMTELRLALEKAVNENIFVKKKKKLTSKQKFGVAAVLAIVMIGVFWFVHPHTYGEWTVVEAATCIEEGQQERKCFCGVKEIEKLPVAGHSVEIQPEIAATCTESGLTEGRYCTVCNEVLVEQTVIEATGHNKVIDPAVSASCTQEGKTEGAHCSNCNAILIAQEVTEEKKGHAVVVDKAVAATCMNTGLTEGSHCSVCNKVIKEQQVIEKTDTHKEVKDKAVAATCQKTGLTEGSHCSVCNKVIKKQESIPKTAHKEVKDKAVAATCTKAGKTEGSHCSACNTVIKKQETVKAKGHSFGDGFNCKNCNTEKFGMSLTTNPKAEDGTVYVNVGDKVRVDIEFFNHDTNADMTLGIIIVAYDSTTDEVVTLDKWAEGTTYHSGDTEQIRIDAVGAGVYAIRIYVYESDDADGHEEYKAIPVVIR